ncbi:hypothetical protein HDV00_010104 [Rhizophlyctis rosea]|nr:hypothetical protein HDV00_010104 [Rhizophlyctis rosea]
MDETLHALSADDASNTAVPNTEEDIYDSGGRRLTRSPIQFLPDIRKDEDGDGLETADVLATLPSPATPSLLRTQHTLNPLFRALSASITTLVSTHPFAQSPTLHTTIPLFPPASLVLPSGTPISQEELNVVSKQMKKALQDKGWEDVHVELGRHTGYSSVQRRGGLGVLGCEISLRMPGVGVRSALEVFEGQFEGGKWVGERTGDEGDEEESENENDGDDGADGLQDLEDDGFRYW